MYATCGGARPRLSLRGFRWPEALSPAYSIERRGRQLVQVDVADAGMTWVRRLRSWLSHVEGRTWDHTLTSRGFAVPKSLDWLSGVAPLALPPAEPKTLRWRPQSERISDQRSPTRIRS